MGSLLEREHVQEQLQPFAGSGREHLCDLVPTGHVLPAQPRDPRVIGRSDGSRIHARHDLSIALAACSSPSRWQRDRTSVVELEEKG
jgi:hypothetical protein